jgi:hypothetical protein
LLLLLLALPLPLPLLLAPSFPLPSAVPAASNSCIAAACFCIAAATSSAKGTLLEILGGIRTAAWSCLRTQQKALFSAGGSARMLTNHAGCSSSNCFAAL